MADKSNLTNMPDPAFEHQLRNLAPAPARLDRDALMFAAGRAGVPRSPRLAWPIAAAALALLAAGEGLALARRTPPQVIERLVVVREAETEPVPTPNPTIATTPDRPRSIRPPRTSTPLTPYQRLGRQLALYGLDALPPPPHRAFAVVEPPAASRSAADLLRDEIHLILNPGDPT